MKRAPTSLKHNRLGDIKKDFSKDQLAGVGLVAFAYNEIEAMIDFLFSLSLGIPPSTAPHVSSRINGIDGKIEIIKIAFIELNASNDVISAITTVFGADGFVKVKQYRDAIIHSRLIDADLAIGRTIIKRGKFDEILLREDALLWVYDLIIAVQKEIFVFLQIASVLSRIKRIVANVLSRASTERGKAFVDAQIKEFEAEIQTYLDQYRRYRADRLSLPPLPEFPK